MNINSRREEIIIELEKILNFSYLNLNNNLIYFMVPLISYTFKVLPIKKLINGEKIGKNIWSYWFT